MMLGTWCQCKCRPVNNHRYDQRNQRGYDEGIVDDKLVCAVKSMHLDPSVLARPGIDCDYWVNFGMLGVVADVADDDGDDESAAGWPVALCNWRTQWETFCEHKSVI